MSNQMKEIDWSKAPEGATHFDTRGNQCSIGFMRPGVRVGEWEYFGIGGHWVLYGPVCVSLASAMVNRPSAWNGEGLPPVGSMVEIRLMGWSIRESAEKFIGVPLRVAASFRMDCGTDMIAVDGGIDLGCEVFRAEMAFPARTPEQIAAEQREKAIREIQADLDVPLQIATRAYEKGYRKEAP